MTEATKGNRIQLGRSPLAVTPLGVGCWAWGDRRFWRYGEDLGPRDIVDAFDACLHAGLDFYDTAEAYGAGKSEQFIGSLTRRSGRELVIATKYAPIAGRGGPRAIPRGLAGSLRRTGQRRIDLYQIHWPDRDEVPIAPTMHVLAGLIEAGQIRAVGVSNFRVAEMREAHAALARRGVPLASNQVHYSLLNRGPEVDGVLDACRELGVTLLAYSPLEQGLLTGKYAVDTIPSGPRADTPSFAPANVAAAAPVIATLRTLADAHGVDPAAIALAWLLAKPGVVPVAGAKTGAQVARNAKALDLELSDGEMASLDAASQPWCVAR
jgi:aryl-alcohol dehydrogenase-like predicted oxidoreductase